MLERIFSPCEAVQHLFVHQHCGVVASRLCRFGNFAPGTTRPADETRCTGPGRTSTRLNSARQMPTNDLCVTPSNRASIFSVTSPALRTTSLHKSFGSLVVAQDIAITLPQGARYALIGPNGAGKTTLINLITGVLEPDAGQIHLGDTDITALAPDRRVKHGLVRTFQINTLFPGLEPLEAVTLAICERDNIAATWWRRLASFRTAVDEAHAILASLNLASVATRPTRELAYGQQRLLEIALALATRPKVLLLDEPAAGVPRQDSGELFQAITNLPSDISVLFIEHDMDLVFRFATRVIVMVGGRLLLEGTPAEIAAEPRVREVYLGRGHNG